MAIRWYDPAVNAVRVLLDGGSVKVYTGSQPAENASVTGTLLATLTFSNPAFGSSSGGTATAGTITAGTAVASGTAGYVALCKSDGTVVQTMAAADVSFNTTSIVSGALVSCGSFTLPGS